MTIENNGYNGWPNYATWRVNLEMFDGCTVSDICFEPEGDDRDDDAYRLQAALKEHAEYVICESSDDGIARSYAMAFLDDVEWYAIAYHMIDAWGEENPTAYDGTVE